MDYVAEADSNQDEGDIMKKCEYNERIWKITWETYSEKKARWILENKTTNDELGEKDGINSM